MYLSSPVPRMRICPGGPSCLHVFECERQKFGGLFIECSLLHVEHVNLKSKVLLFSNVTLVLPQCPAPFSTCLTASLYA